jgi:hypothetical protein
MSGLQPEQRPEPVMVYLAAIEDGIPPWLHGRRAAVGELADGLDDAMRDYRAKGLTAEEAAMRVVGESGPPAMIADEFTMTLSARHARHTALALLLSGPLIGIVWLFALAPGRPPIDLLLRIPPLGLFLVASIAVCGMTLLATGPARLRPSWTLGRQRRLAALACIFAVAADALLLGAALNTAVADPSWSISSPLVGAIVLSIARLTITQRVARRGLVPVSRL